MVEAISKTVQKNREGLGPRAVVWSAFISKHVSMTLDGKVQSVVELMASRSRKFTIEAGSEEARGLLELTGLCKDMGRFDHAYTTKDAKAIITKIEDALFEYKMSISLALSDIYTDHAFSENSVGMNREMAAFEKAAIRHATDLKHKFEITFELMNRAQDQRTLFIVAESIKRIMLHESEGIGPELAAERTGWALLRKSNGDLAVFRSQETRVGP